MVPELAAHGPWRHIVGKYARVHGPQRTQFAVICWNDGFGS
jgi:hypothetical protein